MKNRIKELRQEHDIKQADLAKHIGIAQNTLSYWENGKFDIDTDSLKKIADYFQVSTDYLLYRDTPASAQDDLPLTFDNIFPITKKRFPLLGEIACGEPIYADEDHESYIMAGTDINADFCLKAKGDSMIGARIMDGDIVFIKKMPMVDNGDIAAVIIDDEATLKRIFYHPENNELILQYENPKYASKTLRGEELENVRILGKAVAFQSDVR